MQAGRPGRIETVDNSQFSEVRFQRTIRVTPLIGDRVRLRTTDDLAKAWPPSKARSTNVKSGQASFSTAPHAIIANWPPPS
jgi:hypothetical protein